METVSSWKNKMVVESFIKGQRAALPNAIDQLNVMLHILRHNEVPTKTFVDLGGGDGILSHLILEQFREARGYVLDFSDPMIEAANKRLEKYLDRVKIIKCDIAFPDWHEKYLPVAWKRWMRLYQAIVFIIYIMAVNMNFIRKYMTGWNTMACS